MVIKEEFLCQEDNLRLDQFLTDSKKDFSRSYFKNLISEGHVQVNGKIQKKSGFALKVHDRVIVSYPELKEITRNDIDSLDVELVYESPDFLIINKGPGVLVHSPGHKSEKPTLVDWLLAKFKDISEVGSLDRPGIVHRLDMDTSGLMIIPRTNLAHKIFGQMFKDREIQKTYYALVQGHPDKEGVIDFYIVRHPSIRHKMTHVDKKQLKDKKYSRARESKTEYEVLKYFDDISLVKAMPKTGRTHQIRVHFAGIGHPLIGDKTYGKQSNLISRHALHAYGLEFDYKGKHYSFVKEPPTDFQSIIESK